MRADTRLLILTGAISVGATAASAQTARQPLNLFIKPILAISISVPSVSLVVSTVDAAGNPAGNVVRAPSALSYAITTNQGNQKITASINSAMPVGFQMDVWARAAGGGAGSVWRTVSVAPVDVVTGIGPTSQAGLELDTRVNAVYKAAPASGVRTVTFTVMAG